ncbi:MAG: PqqD family protein [Rhodospirillaceae bacterium]|nr:PqqD family protein [Rhodospirillaceae bacterium]
MSQERYRVDVNQVVSEVFGDETLLINLETGVYYNLPGASSAVWALLSSGMDVPTAVETLARAYAAEPATIEAQVRAFLAQLLEQGLIAPGEAESENAPPPKISVPPGKEAFGPLELLAFTDLQDLLMLDPIHDVGAAGWPVAADTK